MLPILFLVGSSVRGGDSYGAGERGGKFCKAEFQASKKRLRGFKEFFRKPDIAPTPPRTN